MITVSVHGIDQIEVLLPLMEKTLSDYRPFWEAYLAPLVYTEIKDIFASRGRGTWPPLSKAYAAQKAKTHPGKEILRRDDEYFDAATTGSHPGSVAKFTPVEMELGVSGGYFESSFGVNYPALHEDGGSLPARPVYELIVGGISFEEKVRQRGEQYLSAAAGATRR